MHTRWSEVQPDSLLASSLAEATQSEPKQAETSRVEATQKATRPPAAPDGGVASGLIWPPVDGRLVLHELSQNQITLTRSGQGDWSGTANGKWRLHTLAEAVFPEVEQGRTVLVQAARTQASLPRDKASFCCIALAADGQGKFRLWRIERIS